MTPQVLPIVAVIVMNKTSILLGQDSSSKQWTLPKAEISFGQPAHGVAQKAVFETTGVAVTIGGSIFISEDIKPDHHYVVVVAIAQPIGKEGNIEPIPMPGVFSAAKWVGFDELGEYQETVDNLTADAIMKFGSYLQGKARGAM
jgi:ADP-ribose pyrophosphatase YjhB (NUDIX family)